MSGAAADGGALSGDEAYLARLAADGVRTVAEVLRRAELVRSLPDRSNHVLRAGGEVVHVKRRRGRGPSREAAAIRAAAAAGVPTARIAFDGVDARLGSVVGTFDLSPARPVADLVREGAVPAGALVPILRAAVRAAAALHRARYEHHDLYLDHVFADPAAREPSVTIVDLERLTGGHGALGDAVVKDLAALHASLPAQALGCLPRARLLDDYLGARGFPRRRLRGPLLRRIARKAARIRSHVPKTPVGEAGRG